VFNPVSQSFLTELAIQGYALLNNGLEETVIQALIDSITPIVQGTGVHQRQLQTFAIRNLFNVIPETRSILENSAVIDLAKAVLGERAQVTRAIFFDKLPSANWKVAWHQDLTITVKEKNDVRDFINWSMKAGIPHVQAPASVLERVLTLRVHLDDTDESNGALRVLPGTHQYGILTAAEIGQFSENRPSVTCKVSRGGILAMSPLLLHASSPGSKPNHRRVVHLEFSALQLPEGLKWFGS